MEVMRRLRGGYDETPWRGFEEVAGRLRGESLRRSYRGGYEEILGEVLRRLRGGYEELPLESSEEVTRRLRGEPLETFCGTY